ncbi:DEAD/DEAH box helicase [Bacillus sp. E214]|uniref:DEAD/DEAH box helicase n=1 Tax=Bacillus sp. E214 TaxID=2587156 RepID=UPI0011DFE095|nr:AAA domain-containing protein [Bacillus sp. E214]
MNSTQEYIEEWQEALEEEIQYLKKYGSTRYHLMNGNKIMSGDSFTYYFESSSILRIPVGTIAKLEWGGSRFDARILSSEGNSLLLSIEQSIGELIEEATIYHDPWELLDQLIERLDDIRKSKRKRSRVKRIMEPSMPDKRTDKTSKSAVRELYARSKYNPVTYVWGPPGTGKTYTLARTAANKYFKKKRILVLSHSNQAVDVLLAEITAFVKRADRFHEGDILRYGSQTGEGLLMHGDILPAKLLESHDGHLVKERDSINEEKKLLKKDLSLSFSVRDSEQLLDLEKKLGRILEKIRQKEIHLVKNAFIVGTTLAKAAMDPSIFEQEYDLVIIDEASMAFIPQIAFAGALAKRCIICGDFKQLPPIAVSRGELVDRWLKEDIFHRAGVADIARGGKLHTHLFLLKEQRRMHPDISAFTNKYVYNSLVGDHPSVHINKKDIVSKTPFVDRASVLLNTSFTGEHCFTGTSSGSRMNLMNLLLSFQVIHEAYSNGSKSIGYATPYRAQAQLMETLIKDLYEEENGLHDILAATVHRFQGSEREVMVFDSVDSYPQNRAGMLLTGRESERLLNVAITRTKGKLIHVSDVEFIESKVSHTKTLHQLVQYQMKRNQMVNMDQIGKWIANHHPKLQWIYARNLEGFYQDLKKAQSSIILSLPNSSVLSSDFVQRVKTRNSRTRLMMYSPDSHSYLDPDIHLQNGPSFTFVILDQKVLWLGVPLEANKRVHPPYIGIRLESEAFINQFLQQLPK